jgi:uncharacterized protein YegP (UPF0339 family)
MRFMIYEDNDVQFHWRLVDEAGGELAVSARSFASREDALDAAAAVHAGAGSATGTDA